MQGSPWYQIVWVYDSNFEGREFPLVYLANGRPGYVINQYIYDLMKREFSHSKLELHVRALCHLYAFTCAKYGLRPLTDEESAWLVADFLDAKQFGTDAQCSRRAKRFEWLHNLGLHWEPLLFSKRKQGSTLRGYADAITEFDKWQHVHHGANRLSPTETHFMSAWERFQDFKKRKDWDMLLHLVKSHKGTVEQYQSAVRERLDAAEKRRGKGGGVKKSFPPSRIVELVDEAATNVRDKLLILMMLGGSLRRAEPLHVFHFDVEGMDGMGQAMIRLADPEHGMVEWMEDGKQVSGTRSEYFKRYWEKQNSDIPETHPLRYLAPRTEMGRRNQGMHAGFKGMTYSGGEQFLDGRDYDIHYMWWCDPRIGAYWYELFLEYEETYLKNNPYTGERNVRKNPLTGEFEPGLPHPWLFIKIDPEGYGEPLTVTALKAIWRRLKRKLGVDHRLGWHSLRHYFGYYCASILQLRMETVQVLMHHAQPSSTNVYYHLSNGSVRESITTAQLKAAGREDLLPYVITKGSRVPKLPDHWSNDYYKLWLQKIEFMKTNHEELPAVVKQALEDKSS